MQRRHLLRRAAAIPLLAISLGVPALAAAQADESAPLVKSSRILDVLTSKDIVLDGTAQAPAIDLQVQFAFDSAELLGPGMRQLDQLGIALRAPELDSWAFVLAGHTDRSGSADHNLKLSLARAETVKGYLTTVHGVPAARLQTIGHGYARLADPQQPTAAVNRRVEVRRQALSAATVPATGGRLVPTPR